MGWALLGDPILLGLVGIAVMQQLHWVAHRS